MKNKNIEVVELQALLDKYFELMSELSRSHEYWSACNKPEAEWDEYDYMMYPIWLRLKKELGEE